MIAVICRSSFVRAWLHCNLVLLLLLGLSVTVCSQQKPAEEKKESAEEKKEKEKEEEAEEEAGYFPEIEFVASDKFRSFTYIQPLMKRGLNFEGHYFGIEGTDVGIIGGSWTFAAGKHVKLIPGFGVAFGEGQRTAPAITFRWEIETKHVVSQGLFIQALRKNDAEEEEERTAPNIWDGNHVSYQYKRLQIGPLWERIHSREGDEWKGGLRTSFRFWKHISGLLVIVGPDTEVRGGFIIHAARRD